MTILPAIETLFPPFIFSLILFLLINNVITPAYRRIKLRAHNPSASFSIPVLLHDFLSVSRISADISYLWFSIKQAFQAIKRYTPRHRVDTIRHRTVNYFTNFRYQFSLLPYLSTSSDTTTTTASTHLPSSLSPDYGIVNFTLEPTYPIDEEQPPLPPIDDLPPQIIPTTS